MNVALEWNTPFTIGPVPMALGFSIELLNLGLNFGDVYMRADSPGVRIDTGKCLLL